MSAAHFPEQRLVIEPINDATCFVTCSSGDDESDEEGTTYGREISVLYTGGCLLRGPVILKATCKLQLTQWPFDNQTCKVAFGSFTSGKDRMIIKQTPKRSKGLGSDLSGKFSKKQYERNVSSDVFAPPGEGDSPYQMGGDARRLAWGYKFRILVSLGVFWAKRHHI